MIRDQHIPLVSRQFSPEYLIHRALVDRVLDEAWVHADLYERSPFRIIIRDRVYEGKPLGPLAFFSERVQAKLLRDLYRAAS